MKIPSFLSPPPSSILPGSPTVR